MDNEARILLDDVIAFCERDGIEARVVQMLRQAKPVELTDDTLVVEAPSGFARTSILKQRELIESYLEQIAFMPLRFEALVPRAVTAAARELAGGEDSPAPMTFPETAPATDAQAASRHGTKIPQQTLAGPSTAAAPAAGTVTNSVSSADFARLMAQMNGEPQPPALSGQAAATDDPSGSAPAAVPIDSKYTFDTFVRGDENKLALHSAQKFCAFVGMPGASDILFIYGHSGVGKTHLLLAIKNHFAMNQPSLKVKYANSQNYLDDYIGEVSRSNRGGGRILSEYHDADVLIIDDIQNIIGKQQSVEHFFTLMDEFIRDHKKIAIAADRAPKELAMDERLTSRFNSGMLCLVAEPGFEMKYMILKRYYEETLKPMGEATYANVDPSLLEGLSIDCGKLTDEQLRFMAETSGNNIRELESFCERCAHESLEKERTGEDFTSDDIRRIADQYFDTAQKVISIETVQKVVGDFYQVTRSELTGQNRQARIAFARHMAIYLANELCNVRSQSAIGKAFNRDHSTVIHSIKVITTKMDEDRNVFEEHQRLRDLIRLKS